MNRKKCWGTFWVLGAACAAAVGCGSTDDTGFIGVDPPEEKLPICESWFELDGTHAMDPVDDPILGSCYGGGDWSFTVVLLDEPPIEPEPGEKVAPPCSMEQLNFNASYEVDVVETDDEVNGFDQTVVIADVDADHGYGKVTQQGSRCSGQFYHETDDFKGVLSLRPYSDGTTITGTAQFVLHEEAQNKS